MFEAPEKYRRAMKDGPYKNDSSYGNNGVFAYEKLNIIASDGFGWEHVSVSLPHRTPTWKEMCIIKDLFWGKDDLVVQLHPPEADYVNKHPYTLHLWRKSDTNDFCLRPPNIFV